MNILAFIIALPHLFIIWCSCSLQLFTIPLIRDMLGKLPADALQSYNNNIVVKAALSISEVFDFAFSWWFVLIPVAGLILLLPVYILKKQGNQAMPAAMVIASSILSVGTFLMLSVQLITICMLIPNFLK